MTEEAGTPQETDGTPVDPTVDQEPTVEPGPTFMTAEQVQAMMDKKDHDFKTWIGRRDADLFGKIKDMQTPAPDPDQSRDRMLENPVEYFDAMLNQREQKQTRHMQDVLSTAGRIMESDPLYKDQDFGNKVVAEIKNLAPGVNKNVSADIAGRQLVSDAALAVVRKGKATPKNPLENNTPTEGLGSVTSSGNTSKKKLDLPEVSDRTSKYAKKWNYTDEQLAKVFK